MCAGSWVFIGSAFLRSVVGVREHGVSSRLAFVGCSYQSFFGADNAAYRSGFLKSERGSETIVFDVPVSRALFAALLFGTSRP
jgi:hypothetical protein